MRQSVMTLRLPSETLSQVKRAASRRGTSTNRLVQSLVDDFLKEEREKQLYDEFTVMGLDTEETDVEYAIHAASEVALRDG